MTCTTFEREGLARAEAGLPDPHTDGCADCRAARAAYDRVRAAIGETGAGLAPRAGWEARVWAELDRRPSRRGWWIAGGALVAAAAALAIWWQVRDRSRPADGPALAQVELVRGGAVVRAGNAAVGDALRVEHRTAGAAIWIYRGDALAAACSRTDASRALPGDAPDRRRCDAGPSHARLELRDLTAATYQIVSASTALPAPATLDLALAALTRAGAAHAARELVVE